MLHRFFWVKKVLQNPKRDILHEFKIKKLAPFLKTLENEFYWLPQVLFCPKLPQKKGKTDSLITVPSTKKFVTLFFFVWKVRKHYPKRSTLWIKNKKIGPVSEASGKCISLPSTSVVLPKIAPKRKKQRVWLLLFQER